MSITVDICITYIAKHTADTLANVQKKKRYFQKHGPKNVLSC